MTTSTICSLPSEIGSEILALAGQPDITVKVNRRLAALTNLSFTEIAQTYAGCKALQPIVQRCLASATDTLTLDAQELVRGVYESVINQARAVGWSPTCLPPNLQEIGTIRVERLQAIVEWTKQRIDQDLITFFRVIAELSDEAAAFLNYLEEQELDHAAKAQAIRVWMPDHAAAYAQITELDLFEKGLFSIPPEIGLFVNLEILYFQNSELAVIPPEIGKLVNLVELDLFDNKIKVIPPEIGDLRALQRLYLSRNEIKVIPPQIGDLRALQDLGLGSNEIEVIPSEMKRLASLQTLGLDYNEITVLPVWLKQLRKLETFSICKNKIQEVPIELLQCFKQRKDWEA